MDIKDQIKQLSNRIEKFKDNLLTEEATKNALIMPFLQALGYDVFNPLEVVPEYTCDIGTKKGEKIDYAILKDGSPAILIECKHWGQDLILHDNQLLRYFNVSPAKFGLLTNGIIYKFYTDLESENKMDEKPFLEINLTDIKDYHIDELKKFHKSYFDINNILSSASELKYTNELKAVIKREFETPSPELVKLFTKQVYDGRITENVLEQFTGLIKKSIASHINELISDRLKLALKTDDETPSVPQQDIEVVEENKIETTLEELEGFGAVKSMLHGKINSSRVGYKDTLNYFNILLDDSVRKTFCRLYFNSKKKFIAIYDEQKNDFVKYPIEATDDLYNFSEQIISAAQTIEQSLPKAKKAMAYLRVDEESITISADGSPVQIKVKSNTD
jgi:hypothetical protein